MKIKESKLSWLTTCPKTCKAFHLLAKAILQNTGRLDSLKWKLCLLVWALPSIQTCSPNGLMMHLFSFFFSFYIQYTSHLFTSQLVLWKLLNIKVIMNLSVPQCVLQFLCLVPDNKELHLWTLEEKQRTYLLKSSTAM